MFRFKIEKGFLLTLIAVVSSLAIAGCDNASSDENRALPTEYGSLRMPLLTRGTSGDQYRLLGTAVVSGAADRTVSLDGDTVTIQLPVGEYEIVLSDWRLQRLSDDLWTDVDATLDGSETRGFVVRAGETEEVTWTFQVGDDIISFETGDLVVSIDVLDSPCFSEHEWTRRSCATAGVSRRGSD